MTVPVLNSYYFEDLKVGMRETILKTVMDSDVVGFAQISGDDNPLHLSDVYAAKTRFGQRIAHGLYTASLISAVLGTRLPGPGAVYMSQTLNFMGPVRIGDVVVVDVEVIELVEKGRRCRLHCECSVDNQVVLEGEATVMVPGRPKPAVG
ncbi:MaoC family dehydratase [Prosthecomicrobium hirschii]|uniref:MaoC family dehydratase n=1 Tax=Prosthecodimorpha hirschii TaxID=665126 RepID=UPI0011296DF6|nr:MaoC family dehydratase [Prosthecomicrobium hirschii]MCW1843169.1 MaoC family dehydratase [Prosthecomicrobium hirschii]TPQ51921.1 acyl dehydratase [Prosthecomicrobium hirschii]